MTEEGRCGGRAGAAAVAAEDQNEREAPETGTQAMLSHAVQRIICEPDLVTISLPISAFPAVTLLVHGSVTAHEPLTLDPAARFTTWNC